MSEPGCIDGFCGMKVHPNEDAIPNEWTIVAGHLYCPLHAPSAAREERKARLRDEVADLARRKHDAMVKSERSGADYQAWDQFQSDLADFHKKTGKRAHPELDGMNPYVFFTQHADNGRIDVSQTSERLHARDKAAKTRIIDGLGRV